MSRLKSRTRQGATQGLRQSAARKLSHLGRQAVAWVSSFLIAVQPVMAQSTVPGVTSAAGGPEVILAPNGTGMVMINTPGNGGVSHNQYEDFNVGADGLILNNISGNYSETQLGGIVQGNANLAGGAASIILNEVVGGDRSTLEGYLEVAGSRADVIVANPYGLTCNGCGFLNTDRLTLSTGTPTFTGGTFTGLSVDGGDIAIGERGLDALDATRFDLISRQITVAGSVQGQRLRVIAGRNDVIYATGEIIEKPDDGSAKPGLAIDSTVLGGMYAGAISIVSTEDGVGVRAPRNMAASAGEMTLTADGRLVMGHASATGPVSVQTTRGSVQVDTALVSQDSVLVQSAEDIIVEVDAKIVAQAALELGASRDLILGTGAELAAGEQIAAFMGGDARIGTDARVLSFGDVSVSANSVVAEAAAMVLAGASGGSTDPAAATLRLVTTGDIIMRGATAGSGGDIDVTTRVLNIAAQGGIPAGRFVADGTARFALTRLEALDGSLQAGQRLEVENAGGILQINGGVLQADDALLLSGQGVAFAGVAQSLNDTIEVRATAGDIVNTGTLAGQRAELVASGLIENTGAIQGVLSADLTGAEITNTDTGTVQGAAVALAASDITNDGTLFAASLLKLEALGSIANAGTMLSDGNLVIAGPAGATSGPTLTNAANAEIQAAGDLVAKVENFDNAGALAATGPQGRVLITGAGDVTNAATGVIYGQSLNQILSDGEITNDGGALLAQGDLLIGGVTGAQASRFTNQNAGLVETFAGDVQIAAAVFENLADAPVVSEEVTVDTNSSQSGDCSGWRRNCLYTTTTATTSTQVASVPGVPAQIISGADMRLSGDTGFNAYSLISSSGDLDLAFATLTNEGLDLISTLDVVNDYHRHYKRNLFSSSRHTYWTEIDPPVATQVGALFATIEAGGNITGSISGYLQNGAVSANAATTGGVGNIPGLTSTGPDALSLTALGADLSGVSAGSIGNPALIVTNVDPNASYLVETRYEFIDLSQFLSSDYFLASLNYDPLATAKRLGDPYVETQFLRAQLFRLTGQRLLQPGIDERDQIKAMYDGAIDAAENLDLRVGVALTPEQIAALTQDIIWLEEIEVDGQIVLAPRLYLASASSLAARTSPAARITANDLSLIAGEFTNSGALISTGDLRLASLGNFTTIGGTLQAADMLTLDVAGTLRSVSSEIRGADVALAARDIEISTARLMAGEGENYTEGAALTSSITATNSLSLNAVEDLTLTGAQLAAGDDVSLVAGGNLTVGALGLNSETSLTYDGGYSNSQGTEHLVSAINAGGDLTLLATGQRGDIVLEGAQLSAGAGMVVAALQGDVLLEAVADSFYSDVTGSGSGFLSKSSSRDQVFDLSHQVTSLSAGSIDITAAGNILAEGTRFETEGTNGAVSGADALQSGDLILTAVHGDLAFTAPTDIHAESHVSENSFLGGLGGSSSDIRTLNTNALGSVAQVAGNIDLTTGRDLTLTAVDFVAGGDVTTDVAGDTLLLAAVDTDYRSVATMDNNMILITTVTSEDYTENATFNSIEAGGVVAFDENSQVTLDAIRSPLVGNTHAAGLLGDGEAGMSLAAAYLGITDPATAPPNGAQDTQSAPQDWRADLNHISATLPTGADGNGYLYLDGLVERDGTVINAVMLVDEHFYEETQELSPAFKALITVVITQGVGGFGGLAGGLGESIGIASNWGQAAFNSFASNLAVNSAAGVVSGELDIGEILEGAVFSGVTAGLTAGIDLEHIGINLGEGASLGLIRDGGQLTLANIGEGALDGVISSGLSSAVYDTDFAAGVLSAVTASTVSAGLADIQTNIGGVFEGGANGGEGSIGHVTLHALAGCVAAEAQGADCAAGAAGGIASAMVAGYFANNPIETEQNLTAAEQEAARNAQEQAVAEIASGFAGYLVSGGEAANVSVAAAVGLSAMANNRQLHIEEAQLIADYADEYARERGWCQNGLPCDQAQLDRAMGELTAETLRGVADEFAFTPENSQARTFLESLKAQGLVPDVVGQTLFGELDRTSGEYLNSTINMEQTGTTFWLYDKTAFTDGLAAANAVFTASDAIQNDISIYNGEYSRDQLIDYLEANKALADYYGGLAGYLTDNMDALLASGAYESYFDLHDEIEQYEGLAAGLSNNNRDVITQANAVWGGPLTLSDYWAGVNADGTANLIAQIHGQNLSTIAEAGLTISVLTRVRFQNLERGAGADALPSDTAAPNRVDDVPQITRNRLHHEEKVGDVVDDLEARGYQVDTEVSFRGCETTRRCRADVVARDESGRVVQIVEVKTGDAGLSRNQAEIYPQVANGDAIPTGQVAERLGLSPGVPLRDQGYPNGIPVEVRTFEGVNQ